MTEIFVPVPYTFAPDPPSEIGPSRPLERYRIVEGLSDADRGYVIRSWTDSFHRARANYRLPISVWKGRQRRAMDAVLALPGTRALVAHHETARHVLDGVDRGPVVLGWLVWTVGRGWPTVHYAFTRHALDGMPWRGRGVMTELVGEAGLGSRIVYTHRGEYMNGSMRSKRHHPRALDEEIAAWARRQGVTSAYVPLEEWLA
jgi:hypothetical protein